jgi:hypothetical protein
MKHLLNPNIPLLSSPAWLSMLNMYDNYSPSPLFCRNNVFEECVSKTCVIMYAPRGVDGVWWIETGLSQGNNVQCIF